MRSLFAAAALLVASQMGSAQTPDRDLAALWKLSPEIRQGSATPYDSAIYQTGRDINAALEIYLPDAEVVGSLRRHLAWLVAQRQESAIRWPYTVLSFKVSESRIRLALKGHVARWLNRSGSSFQLSSGIFGYFASTGKKGSSRIVLHATVNRPPKHLAA